MTRGQNIDEALQELGDQLLNLTPVDWGFVWITAAAVLTWVWVMGAPRERRPAAAGAAVVVTGLAVGLGLVLLGPHRPA